jgi:hypothetical protein
LIKEAEESGSVRIRRRETTVAFLVSRERMEAIVETLEVLANPAATKAIESHRKGRSKMRSLADLED